MIIHSNIRDYEVHFTETADFVRGLKDGGQRCWAVDANVWRHHADGCLRDLAGEPVIEIPISEERKCLETVQSIYDALVSRSAKRNLTLISIGGGILQDVTGFAASTLYRGIQWIFVPTTLLAQADSCIGSKTSLNYGRFKNLIGTFYPPSQVYIHVPFLTTLQEVDYYSGLGEVVKLHIMGGADPTREMLKMLPALMQRDIPSLRIAVEAALRIKQSYIAGDEFDTGRRNMLNFGHCFGHAIESTSDFEIPHGQAVVVGMLLANIVAQQRGILSCETRDYLAERLLMPSLKVGLKPDYLDVDRIVDAMKQDKKRVGAGLALVMVNDAYEMLKVNDLTPDEVARAVQEAAPQFFDIA